MKIVGVYQDSFEASLAKGRLEEAGIQACLVNEYVNEVMPWGTPQDRAVRLGVADEDYEAAQGMLAGLPDGETTNAVDAATEVVCPDCGSKNVSLKLWGWKKILWAALAVITLSPTGKVQATYRCMDCSREF